MDLMTVFSSATRFLPGRVPATMTALVFHALLFNTALAAAKDAKPAAAVPPAAASVELAAQIELAEGKSTLMHLPYAAARLAVGDTRVADVILINPSEVYMLGKATGSTNLILWNKANQATIIDIVVGLDTVGLRQQFDTLFPTEKDIHITVSGGALILSGTVADSVRAAQVMSIATAYLQRSSRGNGASNQGGAATSGNTSNTSGNGVLGAAANSAASTGAANYAAPDPATNQQAGRIVNMLSVAAPQQVMLEVKIAEVSKTLTDQLGASVGASISSGNWTYTFLSKLLSGNPNVGDAFNTKNGNFLTLDAQKNDGLIKVLAEPTLMAISGQEASFLAGGKIFIPVAQGNTGGSGSSITLEEKDFGIAVKFTPTVLEGGRINLRVAPEVSDLNPDGVGITANGQATSVLPSFTIRRASTTVQLFDGQSFAIGGLIKNNVTTNIKAFPGLGEIPVLGALFRSSAFQSDRTELVFIVTPHLAKPLGPNAHLPTDDYSEPNRFDFLWRGKMEGSASKTPAAAPNAAPAMAPTPAPAAAATGFDVK